MPVKEQDLENRTGSIDLRSIASENSGLNVSIDCKENAPFLKSSQNKQSPVTEKAPDDEETTAGVGLAGGAVLTPWAASSARAINGATAKSTAAIRNLRTRHRIISYLRFRSGRP